MPDLSGVAVLVIEDNRTLGEELMARFQRFGASVVLARDAGEGLDKVREAFETGRQFGLVLVDRSLPEMDGYDLVRRIWSAYPMVSREIVLMATEWEREGNVFSAMLPGLSGWLCKPVLQKDLLRMAASLVPGTTPKSPPPEQGRKRGLRILVAEDCENSRMLLEFVLKGAGHEITYSRDGVEAVERFEEGGFDLIVMDLHLPCMDGYSATRAIRRLERERGLVETPVIAITAADSASEQERSLEAGCTAFVGKPFRREIVLQLLERFAAGVE
jgi:CheY-like chemotaxis protein